VDTRKQIITINFDKAGEESKVHDPFMGQKFISNLVKENNEALLKGQSFFGD